MKNFIYKAKNGPDELIEGVIVAHSTQDVVDQLAKKGLVATFVKEQETGKSVIFSEQRFRRLFGVRLKTLIVFTRQLAKLLHSGIPILRALDILAEQTPDHYFKNVIEAIAHKVQNGQTLSSSLKEHPKIFNSFYIAMVKAGEDSGSIDTSLSRLSDYYMQQYELITKVKAALAYPLLILFVGIGTLVFIFTNVIPRIIPILLGLNMSMPLPTKILIGISDFLTKSWPWLILLAVIVVLIFMRAMKKNALQSYLSHIQLHLPLFGDLYFKSEFSKFARALETSLRSGIPVVTAIDLTLPIINNMVIRKELESSLKELESGGSFGRSLKKAKIFPAFVYNLILIGEESGKLNDALADIAETFEKDCEEYVKVLMTLLEPCMVLAVGLIVGFIVSAVLLPIFQLNFMRL